MRKGGWMRRTVWLRRSREDQRDFGLLEDCEDERESLRAVQRREDSAEAAEKGKGQLGGLFVT